jgi:UPF0755 protein
MEQDPVVSSFSKYRELIINKKYIIGASVAFLFLCIFSILGAPPVHFPRETVVSISKGETLRDVSQKLEAGNYIHFASLFEFSIGIGGSERQIVTGDYFIDAPMSVFSLARILTHKENRLDPIRITFPEGMTVHEIAEKAEVELPSFNREEFITLAQSSEGYLFPDTYFFFRTADAEEVFGVLSQSFKKQIEELKDKISASGHTVSEIITMASLIEKEAGKDGERGIISGILWKRITQRIPLQVDAPFAYILGKSSSELTTKDLAIDSPYNTYKYRGLPPKPIGNPGLASITAALEPIASPYFFYLHGSDGMIRYAKTFEEHKRNKALYLK